LENFSAAFVSICLELQSSSMRASIRIEIQAGGEARAFVSWLLIGQVIDVALIKRKIESKFD